MASITKKGKGYLLKVFVCYDSNGKRVNRSRTFIPEPGITKSQLKKELERQAILFEEECRRGTVLNGKIKFKDYAEQWLENADIRERTLQSYKSYLPRINQAIGHIRLCDLRKNIIEQFYKNLAECGIRRDTKFLSNIDLAELLKKHKLSMASLSRTANLNVKTVTLAVKKHPIEYSSAVKIAKALNEKVGTMFVPDGKEKKQLSGKTIQNYQHFISAILNSAVDDELIFDNPCRRAKLPVKVKKTEPLCFNQKQVIRLLELLENEPLTYKTAITVLVYSGLRRGELLGLHWKDIDFDNCLLDINKSVLYTPSKGVYEDITKTKTSNRVIKIPEEVMEQLKELQREQKQNRLQVGDRWHLTNYVFTQWDGTVMRPDTLSKWYSTFIKQHADELPQVTLHGLRHTHATLLIANNLNLKAVSSRLGHSNLTTTLNTYTHAIQTADALASDLIGDILKQKQTSSEKHA